VRPTVSALIDTFNHEAYIEQSISSVLDQGLSETELEIVVIDDGSTDGTQSIVRKFSPRVRYLRKENGGQASAFNAAFSELGGEVVALLDGDDWWAAGKLAAVLDVFLSIKEIDAVGHGYFEVSDGGALTDMVVPERTCRLDLSSIEAARLAEVARTLLGTSRLAVRRELLKKIGKLPEGLIFCADAPIFSLALAQGGAIVLDQALCYYRLHNNNMFAHHSTDVTRMSRRQEMLALLLELLPRKLADAGVSDNIVSAFLESDRIELERARVELLGSRWQSFRTEMRYARWTQRNPTLGYMAFRTGVYLLSLVLTPKTFHSLMSFYGRLDLKRFRSRLGTAEPYVPPTFLQRRPVSVVSTGL
jgi:glycosyltransferase involved in cell wall biosynthesis